MKLTQKRIRIGDYFAIKLNGSYVTGQYVYFHKIYGNLVRIINYSLSDLNEFNSLEASRASDMFPPVFVFLKDAIKDKVWKKVGHSEVIDFEFPDFVRFLPGLERFDAKQWFLQRDGETIRLGAKLPEQYQDLEVLVIWSFEELTTRIRTGIDPYDQAKRKEI